VRPFHFVATSVPLHPDRVPIDFRIKPDGIAFDGWMSMCASSRLRVGVVLEVVSIGYYA
jgi:hypothetical protein